MRLLRQTVMQQKFARHYRRMLPTLLATSQFRSENRFQPMIQALQVIQRHLRRRAEYFPIGEEIPLAGIVTPKWQEKVLGENKKSLGSIAATTSFVFSRNWKKR